MKEWINKESITIQGAAKELGVKKHIVEEWIAEGRVESKEGYMHLQTVENIRKEINRYISLEAFLKDYDSQTFNSRYARDREKYIDFLEENNYFGLTVTDPEDIVYPYENKAKMYFEKNDLERLKTRSESFFKFFGLDEFEKSKILINECTNKTTKELLYSFIEKMESCTPIVTEFVGMATDIDFSCVNEEDLARKINEMKYVGSKDLMISFVNYVKVKLGLELGKLERKENHTKKDIGAYPYRILVEIGKVIFNEDYLREHDILEKCFDNTIDFEAWLFISIHFVCGWRAQDICDNWPYLTDDKIREFGIDVRTLKDDILQKRITEKLYYEVGKYIEKTVELAAVKARKTAVGYDLLAPIEDELKIFFGRMAFISAYHHMEHGGGRLLAGRISQYLNYVRFKALFGDSVYKLLGRKHLNSRRLNKSYMQSMEERARENGAGSMAAYTIASYARNHSNIDTTAMYIYDHGLNGETADVVLAMMLNRGVFGAIRYAEFLTAFPNVFAKLSAREQTQLLAKCGTSSYELEMMCADMMAELTLRKKFAEGDKKEALQILYGMYEIAQGFGKSKDYGIFCKKRALGESCENPCFKSCLANICPYLIFTEVGVRSLVTVINQYVQKSRVTGNPKYEAILKEVILPAYKDIMFEISKNMSPDEKDALKHVIGEFYGEYIKND